MEDVDLTFNDKTCKLSGEQLEIAITSLNESIGILKSKLNDEILNEMVLEPTLFDDTKYYYERIADLNQQIGDLSETILFDVKNEFDRKVESLEKGFIEIENTKVMLKTLSLIVELSTLIQSCHSSLNEKNNLSLSVDFYVQCDLTKRQLQQVSNLNEQCNIFVNLDTELSHVKRSIDEKLINSFTSQNMFSVNDDVFSIYKPCQSSNHMFEMVQKMNITEECFKIFQESLIQLLFDKFLNNNCQVSVTSKEDKYEISFTESKRNCVNSKLDQLGIIFENLSKTFLNYSSTQGHSFIRLLYKHNEFGQKIVDSICDNLLMPNVPKNVNDLNNFDYTSLLALEKCFYKLGVSAESECFSDFRDNLSKYYVSNFIATTLARSRELILADLSDTVVINASSLRHSDVEEDNTLPCLTAHSKEFLEKSLFHLPQISISVGVKEFCLVVMKCLQQASKLPNTGFCQQQQLLECSRNIVGMYCDLYTTHHEKSEALKVPFIGAIQYNNFMYLAHHCQFWGMYFLQSRCRERRGLEEGALSSGVTFVDFVPFLRHKAEFLFKDIMKRQKNSLEEMLSNESNNCQFGGLNPSLLNNVRGNNSESPTKLVKSLEKSFYFVEQLVSGWKPPVLSVSKYLLAISYLLNFIIKHVVCYCVSLEDITCDDAKTIETFLDNTQSSTLSIVENLLTLNTSLTQDVYFLATVPEYYRLVWLKKIISLSLIDIQALYLSDESEMRKYITAVEIKNLIRALFQNTEMRSMVIGSIK